MGSPSASEETMQEVLQRYEKQGFKGQFGARAGGRIICFTCRTESPAKTVKLLAMHRLEGASDPGEEVAAAAVECPKCKTHGTLTLAFGVGASAEDGQIVKELSDRRDDGPVAPGL
jgi:hypothetical protein